MRSLLISIMAISLTSCGAQWFPEDNPTIPPAPPPPFTNTTTAVIGIKDPSGTIIATNLSVVEVSRDSTNVSAQALVDITNNGTGTASVLVNFAGTDSNRNVIYANNITANISPGTAVRAGLNFTITIADFTAVAKWSIIQVTRL